MSRLTDLLDKLKAADEAAQTQAVLEIITRHKAQLIDANQLQLFAGRNSKGGQLGQYRNPEYALFKNRLNPLPGLGVWDLKLTGRLYDGMVADTSKFPIDIDSTDSKASKFRDADAFGLDNKSLDDYREEVNPEIQEYYKSLFQL